MKKFQIACSIILLAFSACTKDKNDGNLVPEFTGITITNVNGMALEEDPTDWKFNDQWNELEHALFSERYPNLCTTGFNEYEISIFPNPVDQFFNIRFNFPDTVDLELRVVDKDFNVIIHSSPDSISNQPNMTIDVSGTPKQVLRMYYKVIGQNCELRGHGDIQIE